MENNLEDITNALQTSNGNIILKAGAGTGKTYNLTERVISLIINERCRLDQILAMTFTDYAASEMRERIYNRISVELQKKESLDPGLVAHLQREKREFSKNYISTFHSFCSRILQYYPDELSAIAIHLLPEGLENESYGEQLTTRLDSGFEILDDYNEAILIQDWRKGFYKQYKDHEGLHNQLRNLRRKNFEDFVDKVSSKIEEKDLLAMARLSPKGYLQILDGIQSDLFNDIKEKFETVKNIVKGHPEWFKKDFSLDLDLFLGSGEVLTKKGEINKRSIASREGKDPIKTELDPLTSELYDNYHFAHAIEDYLDSASPENIQNDKDNPDFNANHQAYWNLREMAELALRWNHYMRFQRFQAGKLNFDDIIWLTDRLFEDNEKIVGQLRNRFKYVLVDEFQDTNQRQWNIVKKLSRWSDDGNILLVGDMKQAIYRFRGGDVTMMRQAERELTNKNGDRLTSLELNHSFRSNQAVIQFCNALFHHCFSDNEEVMYEASPQSLRLPPPDLSIRGNVSGNIRIMGYSPSEFDKKEYQNEYEAFFKDENEQYLEALRIARFLREIRDGKHDEDYGEIRKKIVANKKAVGILYKRRKHLHFMEQALDLYQLPYAVASGRSFFSKQEIYDCHNLLAFLLDAFDDIALTGVLRSPFTGLSDIALLTIRNVMDHHPKKYTTYWQAVQDFEQWDQEALLPPDRLALSETVPVLKELREESKYVRVSDLLEKAMRETHFLNGYLDRTQAEQNVYKLIDIVRDLEQKEEGNLFEIVEFLRTQIEQDSNEKDAELPDSGAIQIMTVHGSKGLEFPMVIVPDLTASLNNGGLQIYTSPSDAKFNKLPLLAYKAEDKDSHEKDEDKQFIFELVKEQNKKRDIAELKRVFYVALTRAQTHILISDTSSYPKVKNMDISFSGFLKHWLDAEGDQFADLIHYDLLTKDEFNEIKSVVSGEKEVIPDVTDHIDKQLLDKNLLYDAEDNAKLISRNVSQSIHSDEDQKLWEHLEQNPWNKIKADHAGTIIHRILETGSFDREIQEILLNNQLRQLGYGEYDHAVQEDLTRIKTVAGKAQNWVNERFPKARQSLHEQAFECRISDQGEDQYVRGVIDLLIQDENEEWYLIDFKTNAVKDGKFIELAVAAGYDKQLRIYQKATSIITNSQIEITGNNAGLLFISPSEPVFLTLDQIEN